MAIFRYADMPHVVGNSISTVRRKVAAGEFPPPIRLTSRTVGWPASIIEAWLQDQAAKAASAAKEQE